MFGQINWIDKLGGRIGATIQLGKPVNRIGLVINVFYCYDFVELDLEWRRHYNFSNFGPPLKGWENQLTTGVTFAMGKKVQEDIGFPIPFYQHTGREFALSYAHIFYQDQVETSQRSGMVTFQFGRVYVVVENDIMGNFTGRDKFRTGAVSIFYHEKEWMYELKTTMWTGVTSGKGTQTFLDTDYPCRFGYRDISGAKYGRYSHGVLSGQVHRVLDYGQVVQIGIGVDSEHIRNFLQNKLVHDMYFFPPSWTKVRNLHIPMLDENGDAFTYQVGQKVKPASWYLNFALNGGAFY